MGDIPEAIGAVFLQSKLQGMHPGLLKILVPFRRFDAGESGPQGPAAGGGSLGDNPVHQRLGLRLHLLQVIGALEGLRVDLVDVLGAGRAGGEPGVLRDHLQPADGRSVAGRLGQLGGDGLPGQLGCGDVRRRQFAECSLLLPRGSGVDPGVHRVPELVSEALVQLRR